MSRSCALETHLRERKIDAKIVICDNRTVATIYWNCSCTAAGSRSPSKILQAPGGFYLTPVWLAAHDGNFDLFDPVEVLRLVLWKTWQKRETQPALLRTSIILLLAEESVSKMWCLILTDLASTGF